MVELSFKFLHCYNKLGMYQSSYQKPMTFAQNFGIPRYFKLELLEEYEYKEVNNSLTYADHEKIEKKVEQKWNEFKAEFDSMDDKQRHEFFSWMKNNQVMSYFVYEFHPESFIFFTKMGFDFNQVNVPLMLLYETHTITNGINFMSYAQNQNEESLIENYLKIRSPSEMKINKTSLFYFFYTKEHFPQINTYTLSEFLENKQSMSKIIKDLEQNTLIPLINYLNENIVKVSNTWLAASIVNNSVFNQEMRNGLIVSLINEQKIKPQSILKHFIKVFSSHYYKDSLFSLANETTRYDIFKSAIEDVNKNLVSYLINHGEKIEKVYSLIDFEKIEKEINESTQLRKEEYIELKALLEKTKLEQNILQTNKTQKLKL